MHAPAFWPLSSLHNPGVMNRESSPEASVGQRIYGVLKRPTRGNTRKLLNPDRAQTAALSGTFLRCIDWSPHVHLYEIIYQESFRESAKEILPGYETLRITACSDCRLILFRAALLQALKSPLASPNGQLYDAANKSALIGEIRLP